MVKVKSAAVKKEQKKPKTIQKTIGILIAFVLIFGSAFFIYDLMLFVKTDNAYVQANSALLSSRVDGHVEKVFITEFDKVKKGQRLTSLDQEDFIQEVKRSENALKVNLANLEMSQFTFDRMSILYRDNVISEQDYVQAKSQYEAALSQVDEAKAALELSKLNLRYTLIKAPSDGQIARKSVEPGMNVSKGQALFGFVEGNQRWVVANIKETNLYKLRPGMRVKVYVDALDGKKFMGVISEIASATGSTFTLLPPDNSTGNFVKVIQLVPVRIELQNLTQGECDVLQAGLSCTVKINYRQ